MEALPLGGTTSPPAVVYWRMLLVLFSEMDLWAYEKVR